MTALPQLKMLQASEYAVPEHSDPLRLYYWPLLGAMYRRRVEMCLAECTGGQSVLEVGYGSGVTFLNLAEKYDEIHGIDLDANPEDVAERFRAHGLETQLLRGSVLDMPYPDNSFDTVLLISILEHLKPDQQVLACREIARVLKPGGQMVYGVPVERPMMVFMFRLLGYDIRKHHFSTHDDVSRTAGTVLHPVRVVPMKSTPAVFGNVYEVGHFVKS
jgi:ubiquinone/menaquinone biosynthesis C-methylase UbiE